MRHRRFGAATLLAVNFYSKILFNCLLFNGLRIDKNLNIKYCQGTIDGQRQSSPIAWRRWWSGKETMKEPETIERKAGGRLGAASWLGVVISGIERILIALEESECNFQRELARLRSENPNLLVLPGSETSRLDEKSQALVFGYPRGLAGNASVGLRVPGNGRAGLFRRRFRR